MFTSLPLTVLYDRVILLYHLAPSYIISVCSPYPTHLCPYLTTFSQTNITLSSSNILSIWFLLLLGVPRPFVGTSNPFFFIVVLLPLWVRPRPSSWRYPNWCLNNLFPLILPETRADPHIVPPLIAGVLYISIGSNTRRRLGTIHARAPEEIEGVEVEPRMIRRIASR